MWECVVAPGTAHGPRPSALVISLAVHAALFGWAVFGPRPAREEPYSIYRREIAPNSKKLIWYSFKSKLPEVAPAGKRADRRKPKVDILNPGQTIIANAPAASRTPQLIWQPAPRLKLEGEVRSPNLLAVDTPAIPAPVRPAPKPFTPPQPHREVRAGPALPEAPKLAARAPQPLVPELGRVPRPARRFVPPSPAPPKPEAPALEGAPVVAGAVATPRIPSAPRATLRAFTPPAASRPKIAAPEIEQGPHLAGKISGPSLPAPPRAAPRQFTPKPAAAAQHPATPVLSEAAPSLAPGLGPGDDTAGTAKVLAGMRPIPRPFVPPPGGGGTGTAAPLVDAAPGPALSPAEAGPPAGITAAVVGLRPSAEIDAVLPNGSRDARFAAGPELNLRGGAGSVPGARLSVPGLLVTGGSPGESAINRGALIARAAPTSPEALRSALRSTARVVDPAEPAATRVSSAPDPRLEGRTVYTLAVQMPNITSYSGSWILWFAERDGNPGGASTMHPPWPLRKVDPKYIAAAASERIEGKVRLFAVIGSDGRVLTVTRLAGVDPRLDASAEEALRKWEFEPAQRAGQPVPVDAVVEIPFRLAPLRTR